MIDKKVANCIPKCAVGTRCRPNYVFVSCRRGTDWKRVRFSWRLAAPCGVYRSICIHSPGRGVTHPVSSSPLRWTTSRGNTTTPNRLSKAPVEKRAGKLLGREAEFHRYRHMCQLIFTMCLLQHLCEHFRGRFVSSPCHREARGGFSGAHRDRTTPS